MRATVFGVVLLCLLAGGTSAAQSDLIQGRIEQQPVAFRLFLFFAKEAPAHAEVATLVARDFPGLRIGRPLAGSAPLDNKELAGVESEGALEAARGAREILAIDAYASPELGWWAVRETTRLAELLLQRGGVAILDGPTRQLYAPEDWHERRVENVAEPLPEIWAHVLSYGFYPPAKGGKHAVAILGMRKFGLPDLVVDDVDPALMDAMMLFAQFVAQALVERGGRLDTDGAVELDLRRYSRAFSRPVGGAPVRVRFARAGERGLRLVLGEDDVSSWAQQRRVLETAFGPALPR